MARTKARAEIRGEPLIKRLVRALTPCAENFTVVADVPGKYADLGLRTIADDLGLRTIADLRPGLGPMGGLLTALKDLSAPGWVLLCSCDFVVVDSAWVSLLVAGRLEAGGPNAVTFEGERIEPLFALYNSNLIPEIERSIDAGELSPGRLIARVPSVRLPLPANWPKLAHVNTREELTEILATGSPHL